MICRRTSKRLLFNAQCGEEVEEEEFCGRRKIAGVVGAVAGDGAEGLLGHFDFSGAFAALVYAVGKAIAREVAKGAVVTKLEEQLIILTGCIVLVAGGF